jgi:hypothetical protein
MALAIFFRGWWRVVIVVVFAVRERDHDGWRVQVRFVVR